MCPEIVVCGKCREVLYASKDHLKDPTDVIEEYDGKCPYCGKQFSLKGIKVEVKTA